MSSTEEGVTTFMTFGEAQEEKEGLKDEGVVQGSGIILLWPQKTQIPKPQVPCECLSHTNYANYKFLRIALESIHIIHE